MKSLLNNLFISIGISLVVAVIVGNMKKIERYYLVYEHEPKREVTKEMYSDKIQMEYGTIEKIFNRQQAITFGLLSFGGCLIILGIANKIIKR